MRFAKATGARTNIAEKRTSWQRSFIFKMLFHKTSAAFPITANRMMAHVTMAQIKRGFWGSYDYLIFSTVIKPG